MSTTNEVTAAGWELHCYDPVKNHDKLYRVFVIGSKVVVNWGRRPPPGKANLGAVKVHMFNGPEQASRFAAEQTDKKERKGYEISIKPVLFTFNVDNIGHADRQSADIPFMHELFVAFGTAVTEGAA